MKNSNLRSFVFCAMCCALTCVLAIIEIPIGAVPITFATVGVYFASGLLKPMFAFFSQVLYIILLAVGLPFAAGAKGGLGVLLGPTGGYIIGYALMAFVAGSIYDFIEKSKSGNSGKFSRYIFFIIACEIGTFVCYLFGLFWFIFVTKMDFVKAFSVCVLPFLPGDFIKILVSALVVFRVKNILNLD